MRESVKATLALVFAAAILVTAIAWSDAKSTGPGLRFGVPALGLIALGVLLKTHFGKDKAPDFLRARFRTFFERDGFCFVIVPEVSDGVCWMAIYYQNKYDQPSNAIVVVKPSFGFFLNTRPLAPIAVEIACGPGSFGVAHVPWAIPGQYQGLRQRLDVGASVSYPRGRGNVLRYRDGIHVSKHSFHNQASVHLLVTLGTVGQVRLSKPASITIMLPENVAEAVPRDAKTETREVWRLGDATPVAISTT